uniref:Uncharacterized protein n=1 Tax=Triticum urartu TaxID=4572 RepID=A0A8R7PNM4_TRIUA
MLKQHHPLSCSSTLRRSHSRVVYVPPPGHVKNW